MWRPGLLLREAYRNLGPRALVLGLAVATVLAIVGVATALMAISVLSQQEGQLERGAAVWWVESDADGGPVPARVCAELQGSPGVAGAGAVGREQVEWRAFPSARGVTIDVATPGLWAAWGAPRLNAGVVAGADLVDTGLVGVGSILYDGGGQAHRIEARTPASVKTSRLLANVVVTRPPDFDMSECWVRMEPGSISAGPDLLAFAFADYGVEISPFVADETALLSPQEQWQAYAALAPGLVAGVLIGLLIALANWGRRSEFAVYRTFGTATSELVFLLLAEVASCCSSLPWPSREV